MRYRGAASIVGMKPQESIRILADDLTVTFLTFAASIRGDLGTMRLIFFNGLLISVIATACRAGALSRDLWIFVCQHRSLRVADHLHHPQRRRLRLATACLPHTLQPAANSIALAGREAVRPVAGILPCW